MRKIAWLILLIVSLGIPVAAQEWKVARAFLIPSGEGKGEIGPTLQVYEDIIARGKGDTDEPWGVSGLGINADNNLLLLDNMNQKLVVFSPVGEFIKEHQGIGGKYSRGFPFGDVFVMEDTVVISNRFSFTVYAENKLENYKNLRQFGEFFRRAIYYTIIDATAYYWDSRVFWCIPDIADPNSTPVELKPDHELVKKNGIVLNNGKFYLPNGELLFKDFSIYQPAMLPNDINKGTTARYIGKWEDINVWIQGSSNAIIGPIGPSTRRIELVSEEGSKTPANNHFAVSSDGYIYFTEFSLDEGGTIVNRLNLRPFLEEKKKLEGRN